MIGTPSEAVIAGATVGAILAGGAARRMGGGDKTLTLVAGESILERIVGTLRPQCAALILNANGDPDRFAAFGLPVLGDDVPGRPGPMAGILAGLDWTAAHIPDAAWLLSVPADTPFLPNDLAARLHAARVAAAVELAYAASDKRHHPTVALWPVRARHRLREALVVGGVRRMTDFVGNVDSVPVWWDHRHGDPFLNVNSPEDLALLAASQDQGHDTRLRR